MAHAQPIPSDPMQHYRDIANGNNRAPGDEARDRELRAAAASVPVKKATAR